jgi:hypothetical protein
VSGASGVDEPIGAGEAVFLHEGEDHEMKSEAGLTALIIEGESLDRFRERPASRGFVLTRLLKRHSRTLAHHRLLSPAGARNAQPAVTRSSRGRVSLPVPLAGVTT